MDRIGLGWRPELAAAILSHLDDIDVVEVIVDDYFRAPKADLHALRTLAMQVPVIYHGVGLGLASSIPVDEKRLSRLAHVIEYLQPEIWSEHLSFVRGGGHEIGHLAAPPRSRATIDGAIKNLERIRHVVGSAPVLENIATLIDPPGSAFAEAEWTSEILRNAKCGMLMDLHNLYANAVNFGHDPFAYLDNFPVEETRIVHLSGGHWIPAPSGGRRLLDDHVHDVPGIVFELLGHLVRRVRGPLTVIIERDGEFPQFSSLLNEVRRAREVLREARAGDSLERAVI